MKAKATQVKYRTLKYRTRHNRGNREVETTPNEITFDGKRLRNCDDDDDGDDDDGHVHDDGNDVDADEDAE